MQNDFYSKSLWLEIELILKYILHPLSKFHSQTCNWSTSEDKIVNTSNKVVVKVLEEEKYLSKKHSFWEWPGGFIRFRNKAMVALSFFAVATVNGVPLSLTFCKDRGQKPEGHLRPFAETKKR